MVAGAAAVVSPQHMATEFMPDQLSFLPYVAAATPPTQQTAHCAKSVRTRTAPSAVGDQSRPYEPANCRRRAAFAAAALGCQAVHAAQLTQCAAEAGPACCSGSCRSISASTLSS